MTLTLSLPLDGLTPVEDRNGIVYKRDDLLAFSNGVNGKVRTSLHLARKASENGASGLVYGGSVHAPALGRVASAAAYMGLECVLVIGSQLRTARRHQTIQVAEEAGAHFVTAAVAYNPALQKKARELAAGSNDYLFQVPYGVSTDPAWGDAALQEFVSQDADQVANLPDRVTTLVLPFGSGNAATGVLYGLAESILAPAGLERVVLMGIGPDRKAWLLERLSRLGVTEKDLPPLEFVPLHPHYAVYADRMPETLDGIDFHPTYEGKMIRYLNETAPDYWTRRDGTTAFWIVGGPLPKDDFL